MARYHVHIGRANGTRETLHCLAAQFWHIWRINRHAHRL